MIHFEDVTVPFIHGNRIPGRSFAQLHCILQNALLVPSICIFSMLTQWPSSVGIATRYEPDGPGIESGEEEIFSTRPDRPWGPPSLLYNGYRVIPGGKAAGAWSGPPTLI
jgi:hypothetical protein